jgi:hypothetical protein
MSNFSLAATPQEIPGVACDALVNIEAMLTGRFEETNLGEQDMTYKGQPARANLFANPDKGSYTAVLVFEDKACIVGMGKDWKEGDVITLLPPTKPRGQGA